MRWVTAVRLRGRTAFDDLRCVLEMPFHVGPCGGGVQPISLGQDSGYRAMIPGRQMPEVMGCPPHRRLHGGGRCSPC
jgi:hypothetical protein